MRGRELSPEIVSLVHHVELNESGWWRKAIGQVIKGMLWKATTPQTISELHILFQRELGLRLSDDVLIGQLKALVSQGVVVEIQELRYKLSERAFQELSAIRDKAVDEQLECQNAFIASCSSHCPDLCSNQVWQAFKRDLSNAIQVSGANLYHLIVDGNLQKDVDWLSDFISGYPSEQHEGLRLVLTEFFAPDNHACRNQVLRFLTAYFFAEAAQLRPETLDVINRNRKTKIIKVVLDTNFIFSVLQLHDNPADEAALSLVGLAKQSHGKLEIKLYVLPSTIEEAKRVLLSQMYIVERIRTTRPIVNAALSQPLPSIARRFFRAAAESPGLTAGDFFQPYIDDLKTILQDKNIVVLDAHPTIYHQRQDVIDDVLGEQQREAEKLSVEKQKSYEALLHDVVLWHAVNDRRPLNADSPFDVEFWAVSIDWRLIGFDRFKRVATGCKLPVVLHPSNFVQLIQFWVPRTQELEDSLVDAFRLPLFFQSFDPEDEQATVNVLASISRYQNLNDLSESTIQKVLTNRALRVRLSEANAANDQMFELVHEEVLSIHKDTVAELEIIKLELKNRDKTLEAERFERVQADTAHATASKRAETAEQRAEELEAQKQELSRDLSNVEARASADAARAHRAESRVLRQRYIILFCIFPVIVGLFAVYQCAGYVTTMLPALQEGWRYLVLTATLFMIPVCLSCFFSPYYVKNNQYLESWRPIRAVHKARKKLIVAPLSTGVTAIYQGGVWDTVSSMIK